MWSEPPVREPDPSGESRLPRLRILPVLFRYWKMILAITVLASLAMLGLSYLQTTRYQATAHMTLSDPRTAGVFRDQTQVVIDLERHARNQAALATSTQALQRTSELIDGRLSADELDDLVSAEASRGLDLVRITALDATPQGAKEIADAVGQAYQDLVREEVQGNAIASIAELDGARDELQSRIAELEEAIAAGGETAALRAELDAAAAEVVRLNSRAKEISVDATLYGSGVQVFQAAEVPESPAQPRPLRNAAVVGIVGLLVACAAALWLGRLHPIAEGRQDPAPILGAPLLGVVPDLESVGSDGKAPSLTQPSSVAAEAFRLVASSLEGAIKEQGPTVVCVTSARQGDGKTVVALNVAAAATLGGRRVVLVDGSAHTRGLSRWVELNEAKGLTDLGSGAPPEECVQCLEWGDRPLRVCPAGSLGDAGPDFFQSSGFRKAMAALREQGDLIVIDAPPARDSADTLAIAGQSGGVVLVVEIGTPLHAVEEAGERITMLGTPLLGYVFNRAPGGGSRRGLGRRYGYGPRHRSGGSGRAYRVRHRRS